MEYVRFGDSGVRVSRVCLGMMSFGETPDRPWALGEANARPIIHRAIEGGIRFFDTADVYNGGQSEVLTGRILDQGVAVMPWSPLARGRLAGNRGPQGERLTRRAETDPFGDSLYPSPELDQPVIDRVNELAAERGVPAAQVGLAWLLHKPGVTAPIVGATKASHLEDALAAEQLQLSEDELRRLEEPYLPHLIAGH